MAVKTLLLATALLLAGLATQGAEARIVAIIHGSVTPAAIAAGNFQVSTIGEPSVQESFLSGNESEGNFTIILNVTSSEMMASLVSNSSVVVSPPHTQDMLTALTAPLVQRGVRRLVDSLADSQIRAALGSLEGITVNLDNLPDDTTTDLVSTTVNFLDFLARGSNDSFAATSYDVESSIDGFAVFGIGTLSTSAGN
uniref:Uncharacterized protein n=1 Tax=Leersia perrieri TaxID=77586 RepID=A0A0D9X2V5_9ORYZ